MAAGDALAVLDHRRGEIAAHCCFAAAPGDWLRVAMLLAGDDHSGLRAMLAPGFLAEIARENAVNPGQGLVWRVVEGEPRDGIPARALVLDTPGRVLAAAPGTGRALFWAGSGTMPDGLVLQLLLSADSGRAE